MSDIEKYYFIKSMITGGISMIFKVYTAVKNKFLKSYDPKNLTSYIIYLDTNNLNKHSLMQILPFEICNDWSRKLITQI